MMVVREVEVTSFQGSAETWDAYVSAHPEATKYHLYAWRSVIERSFGHRGVYLVARRDGVIRGVLPLVYMRSLVFGKFLTSLPFLNYGGILADGGEEQEALLSSGINEARRRDARHVELRYLGRRHHEIPTKTHKVTMILPLEETSEKQWKSFEAKLRNQVRKAEKMRLTVREGDLDRLDDFYTVFARNMRDLGTPVYGRIFFSNILNAFPDSTRIFTVHSDGRAVAGGFASWWRNKLEVPWASSLREYNASCPNNLLYWAIIQFAIKRGFKEFDFGRSTPGEGTYRFKEQWGAKPVPLYWQYWLRPDVVLPDQGPRNAMFQSAISLWRRLPIAVTKILGPAIIRNIP